uniref:Connexin N-terminal domain-containing protein n=1 Tax=Knipowitschia caucasica TaxID=637954 RepID=A0AAV2JHV2_KNICA
MGDWNLLGSILEEVIFVSAPSLVYMGHALYCIRALEKERHRKRFQLKEEMDEAELLEEQKRLERELKRLEEQKRVKKAPLRGSLLRTYVIHILTRSVLETFKVVPETDNKPPHYTPGLKDIPRHHSIAYLGHGQANYICQQPRMVPRSSLNCLVQPHTHQSQDIHTSIVEQHQEWASVESTMGGSHTEETNEHEDDRPQSSHLSALLSASRPSVVRVEGHERRTSMGSQLLMANPRKTSFMMRPPSESMSSMSGSSSPSMHSSEESDELGSLQGDMPMMPPGGGRRMSMSMFLDISSIMKK